jgi:hypothetical protein
VVVVGVVVVGGGVVVVGGGGGGVGVVTPGPLPPPGVGGGVDFFPPLGDGCPERLTGLVAGPPSLPDEPPPAPTCAVGAGAGPDPFPCGPGRWCVRVLVGGAETMTFSVGAEPAGVEPEPDRIAGRRTVLPESRIRAIAAPPRTSAARGGPATRAIVRSTRPLPCSLADNGLYPPSETRLTPT